MKYSKHIILICFLILSNLVFSQHRNFSDSKPLNITEVAFTETDIILNSKISYKYERSQDSFSIKTLDDHEIITGVITNTGYNKFETTIIFLEYDIEFSNPKIIGRNDLIFAFVNFNVFNSDATINIKKFKKFIKKYNKIKK